MATKEVASSQRRALAAEVRAMQNPALGALLLSSFMRGYSPGTDAPRGAPLPLLFLVLPVALTEQIRSEAVGTQPGSGLRAFEAKFARSRELILLLERQVTRYRELTKRSLAIALRRRLVRLELSSASVWLLLARATADAPEALRPLMRAAERLGAWCGALSLDGVQTTLRVEL